MSVSSAIEVALIDEQELMRAAYQQILADTDEFEVRSHPYSTEGFDAIAECVSRDHGVLVVGCSMVTKDICGQLLGLVSVRPDCGLILVFASIDGDARAPLQSLSVKAASGFAALKRTSLSEGEDLRRLVRQVHAGQVVLDVDMLTALVGRGSLPGDREELARLTGRELEVLALMAQGRNNASVADDLAIRRGTVDRHTYNIYQKLTGCPRGTLPRAYATALYREYAPDLNQGSVG